MTGLFTDPRLPSALARLAAPGGYVAFEDQVRGARFCRRPVRLKGSVVQTGGDGIARVLFDSASQPDRVLLKACGTRRQTLCPPCASIYRGDAFALVAAGLRGGKGMPEAVSEHPAVLLTLTAPSFGLVHRTCRDGSCHRSGPRCPHGRALRCGRRHTEDDPALGQALCPSCYDYEAAVLFNASVSELWRRTTIYALRALGNLAGTSVRAVAKEVRLSYVKVVEFQRRGSVHLHAVVRLDGRCDGLSAPPERFSAELLAAALELAARRVSAPLAGADAADRVRWGRELDVAVVTDKDAGRRRAAAYLAKYSTKSTEDHGVLDHRLRTGVPDAFELSDHLRSLVESAWRLGGAPGGRELRLRAWAHTAGYRGHCLTKSRRFSTTFTALRAIRQEWRVAEKRAVVGPTAKGGTEDDNDGIVGEWTFVGMGYTTTGDAWLAESIAEEERLARRSAYQERQDELREDR